MINKVFSEIIHYYPNLLLLLVLSCTFPQKPRRRIRVNFPVFFILLCICDHFALLYSERGNLLQELRGIFFLLLYISLAFCFAELTLEGWALYHLSVITMWWFFYGAARSILFAAAQSVDPALEARVLPILLINNVLQTLFSVWLCRLRINSFLRIRPVILWCVCLLSVFVEELLIATDGSFSTLNKVGLLRKETAIRASLSVVVIFMYWCISMLLRQLESLFFKEHQASLQKLELDFAKEMHRQSRKTAHDIKNHLMVMESFLNHRQYGQLEAYLNGYLEENEPFLYAVSSGNATVDAVLYRERQKAEALGIPMEIDAALPEKLSFPMAEFSSFLFNSIDNAIEASAQVPEPEIYVAVRMRERFCIITVTNKVTENILQKNPRLDSTKSAGGLHGCGTGIMREFARKYNGDLQFSQEDDLFKVSLMIQEVADEI